MRNLVLVDETLYVVDFLDRDQIHHFDRRFRFFVLNEEVGASALLEGRRRDFIDESLFLQLIQVDPEFLVFRRVLVRVQYRQQTFFFLIIVDRGLDAFDAFAIRHTVFVFFSSGYKHPDKLTASKTAMMAAAAFRRVPERLAK